jgi:hypothetical protein
VSQIPSVLFDVVAGGRRLMQGAGLEAFGCSDAYGSLDPRFRGIDFYALVFDTAV